MAAFDSLTRTYIDSVFKKDIETHLTIYDDKILAYDMWNNWFISGIEGWNEMAKGWFNGMGTVKDVVEFSQVKTNESESLATMTAIIKFTGVDESGKTLRFLNNRLTWIAIKKNDVWKIVHQHTSAPIRFPEMTAILQAED